VFMKQHILAALREEFDQWEALLASKAETQLTTPVVPSELSIKDELAHLLIWQQRSIARLEAAQRDQEPVFPKWPIQLTHESDEITEQINAWIFESHRDLPWPTIYQQWRAGYLHMLAVAETIAEPAMLDSSRYVWLEGYSIAIVLVSSYDHHQEHFEKLVARL
jgi:hypothetical protein